MQSWSEPRPQAEVASSYGPHSRWMAYQAERVCFVVLYARGSSISLRLTICLAILFIDQSQEAVSTPTGHKELMKPTKY
jgi:hypothetical protein